MKKYKVTPDGHVFKIIPRSRARLNIANLFVLYPDNTEALLNGYTKGEITKLLENRNVQFGKETPFRFNLNHGCFSVLYLNNISQLVLHNNRKGIIANLRSNVIQGGFKFFNGSREQAYNWMIHKTTIYYKSLTLKL